MNRIVAKRTVAALLAALMVFACFTVSAADKKTLIFEEKFQGTSLDANRWASASHSIVSDGMMKVAANKWPTLKLGVLESGSAYELSYKIKANSASTGQWKCCDVINGISFGAYKPGSGFSFTDNNITTTIPPEYSVTGVDEWYTVVTEFSQDAGLRYKKWSVYKENGDKLFSGSYTGLYKDDSKTLIDDLTSVSIESIYFWNTGGSDIFIKDVEFYKTEQKMPTPEKERVLIDEDFENMTSVADLTASGVWTRATKVEIEDGMLVIPNDAYVYFNTPKKFNTEAYRVTYEVMTPKALNDSGNLSLVGEGNKAYLLGTMKAGKGFSCVKADFEPSRTFEFDGGKWYNVVVEFTENPLGTYSIYSLYERDNGKLVDTYTHPRLEDASTASEVTENVIKYYFWNRQGADETYYIDRVKFELIEAKPSFNPDTSLSAITLAGEEITDFSAPVTPGIDELRLNFGTMIDLESVESEISVVAYDDDGNEAGYISYTPEIDDKSVVLRLDDIFDGNTVYGIKIGKSISNMGGDKLNQNYEVYITTKPAKIAAEFTGAFVGGRIIDGLSDLVPGGNVEIRADIFNDSKESTEHFMCLVFFDGNKMVTTQGAVIPCDAASCKNISQKFTVPSDMKEIDTMYAMIWTSAADMLPICTAFELK